MSTGVDSADDCRDWHGQNAGSLDCYDAILVQTIDVWNKTSKSKATVAFAIKKEKMGCFDRSGVTRSKRAWFQSDL